MKPKLWSIVSVFIGIAVFLVLVLAFFNFGMVERAGCSSDQAVQRRVFDANTITFMSSFILVVLFSILFSTQNRLASQSRALEKQTKQVEKERNELTSSMKHSQQINAFMMESQAIGSKCILLLYMIYGAKNGSLYLLNPTIKSTFSECNNGICDLKERLTKYNRTLETHERHIILSPLVDSFHKFQAFKRFNQKSLDPALDTSINELFFSFNKIGVS